MSQETYVVVRGDTLTAIAKKYDTTVASLAALNNIANVNRIYIGQVLIIRNKTITPDNIDPNPGVAVYDAYSNPYVVVITGMGQQSNNDSLIFITWSFKTPNTDSYEIEWGYSTADGRWFRGSNDTVQNDIYGNIPKESTYSPPDNAVSVRSRIRPVAKTYTDTNENEVLYWNGQWTNWQTYSLSDNLPLMPPVPSVKVEGYDMTVYNANLDINATHMEYEIVWGDKWHYKTGIAEIASTHAWFRTPVTPSWNYKARGRGKRGDLYGPWSEYSSNIYPTPSKPYGIDTIEAVSETAVKLTWTKINSAKTYSIEYTDTEMHFEGSNGTTVIDNISDTHYIVTGLTSGKKYFFRLKCVNDTGSSGWCDYKSVILGTKPEPPSTWSDKTVAIVGERVMLSWLHNSVDGSEQTQAVIETSINGSKTTYSVTTDENDKPVDTFELPTSMYADGTKIYWRVKTKGVVDEYSDWSIQRLIEVYAPATLSIDILDNNSNPTSTILNFPFVISGYAGPQTQTPIMYSVSVKSKDSYIAHTPFGDVHIGVGDEIYSVVLNSNKQLSHKLTASDIDLENGISYEITVRVTMDSGLSADATKVFNVSWTDVKLSPNAEIIIDQNELTASIRPYCERYVDSYRVVNYANGRYVMSNVELPNGFETAVSVDKAVTTKGQQVYKDNLDRLFCILERENVIPVTDVVLSVYRRTYDGKFVEISKDIDGHGTTFVTDPHPSLDYARYRIVSMDNKTGATSYTDVTVKSFNSESIIIQWDERWSNFIKNEDNYEDVDYSNKSIVKLPYNVSITENNSPEISTVNYIGREHPVSYYGTALGVSSSITSEFDKSDADLLYALRRLSMYMGDVYIRIPSGIGYWANVKVSYDRSYDSLVIPVTIDVVRVEGGI